MSFEKSKILAPHVLVRPRLGVIGGMGPLATADFLTKLATLSCAPRDEDHLAVVAASIPQIPDRTSAFLADGASPLPALVEVVRLLEAAGAARLAIPCNTAHLWHNQLVSETTLPILHIVDSVAALLQARGLFAPQTVALLATDATVTAGIYQSMLGRLGYHVRVPAKADQQLVMASIRAVKAGDVPAATRALKPLATRLIKTGCANVLLGCTELPLALAGFATDRMIDTSEALAIACLNAFGIPTATLR